MSNEASSESLKGSVPSRSMSDPTTSTEPLEQEQSACSRTQSNPSSESLNVDLADLTEVTFRKLSSASELRNEPAPEAAAPHVRTGGECPGASEPLRTREHRGLTSCCSHRYLNAATVDDSNADPELSSAARPRHTTQGVG